MELLNVSAGSIHTVQIGTEVVRTGHIKSPVAQPWEITDQGVAGDQRAVHPDTLYAFARRGYDHWGAHLSVDPSRWPDGFFGENLTFDDFDEADLRIGDVFALGDEVRLFVAGARNPCNKLAWRLNQPATFQKLFARSRRAGVYFGVEQAGIVRSGDRLVRVRHDPTMPSIADVSAYIIDREPPPLLPLQRILAYDRLSPTNRLLLGGKLDAAERAADAVEGRWRGWRAFTVSGIVEETADIRSINFAPVDGGPLCLAKPGQFVTVRMDDGTDAPVTRAWSLSRSDDDQATYRVTVRRQDGVGSQRLHRLALGDSVMLRAPTGDFVLNRGSFRPVVLIAAGIGVTPLKAMLDAQLARPDAPAVRMLYAGRSPATVAFREELERLAQVHDKFELTMVYSQADEPGSVWGRITPELVIRQLQGMQIMIGGQRHDVPWYETDVYLCGPTELCRTLTEALVRRGANADRIFQELFTSAPLELVEVQEARIVFSRSDRTAIWRAGEDLSLLELAEDAGIDVPSSCRSGSCLSCRSTLLDGEATGSLGDGTVLPCIARPKTATLVLHI